VLRDLQVHNLAVIAEATVEFGPGLNVLTGETGAGKSIVVDSLALLSGVRASSDLIRTGAETLSITGVFRPAGEDWRQTLAAAGISCSGEEIVVRREINRDGRNRVFLDDQLVTLNLLAKVAPQLICIHTQREEFGLVSSALQRRWLDHSAGDEALGPCQEVRDRFEEYRQLADRLERVEGDERLRLERIDLLRYQSGEIDGARLRAGEEEPLRQERDVLRHSEAITEALGLSYGLLFEEDGAAGEGISQAIRKLKEIADWEPQSAKWCRELEEISVELAELSRDLRSRLDAVEADPARLDTVEERLVLIERLVRKYGGDTEQILQYREKIGRELEELSSDAEQRQELAQQRQAALQRYGEAAAELSRRRQGWGESLAARVHEELQDLAMGKARFAVGLETRNEHSSPLMIGDAAVDFAADGYDRVVFRLAANPGEEMAPLSRSASGGELSRIYLAVQLASRLNGPAAAPTLVFDEVDAGIGGSQAAALGRKLKRLAGGGQILVVTHLPQVASHADSHFKIHKRVSGGRTQTSVQSLEGESRTEEVARMLAGKKVTTLSRSHAEELIAAASLSR